MRCKLILITTLFFLAACQQPSFQRGDAVFKPDALPTPEPKPEPPPEPVAIDPTPQPLFQECDKVPDRQMVAELYPLEKDIPHLPDFSQMQATKKLCLKQLDITDRDFKEGFPGVDGLIEWFGLNIRFKLRVPVTGDYEFALNSDDGSRLFIDGVEIIDNDGQHEQKLKAASTHLTEGLHEVRVPYFQGPRYRIALELKWKGPGDSARAYIPETLILRP